jgi:beta-lactamase class D
LPELTHGARFVLALLLCLVPLSGIAFEVEERPGIGRHFDAAGTQGTIVVRDVSAGKTIVHDRDRAERGYLPASTFKIPASLIALETGVVQDADKDVLKWDGVQWIVPACNADQTLATALVRSCVPIFAALGKRIGEKRLNAYLADFDYGNHDATGFYPYWLEGNLRISALEQIAFLDRLRRDALPISSRHMQTVRDILVIEEGPGYVMRAKTGWATSPEPEIGWIVGWVERGDNTYLFALNIDIAKPEHVVARLDIAKSVLSDLGALP